MRKSIFDIFKLNASRREEEEIEKLRKKIPFTALSLAVYLSSPIIPSCELTMVDNRQKLKDKT